jgi:hypothetical protein
LQRGKYRGTPILVFDEVTIKKISGNLGKSFRVDLSRVFPPVPNDETQTAAPSVGHVSASIPLNFVASMPQPQVHIAAPPPAQVHVVNDIQRAPPPPLLKELRIIRDPVTDKITGAILS